MIVRILRDSFWRQRRRKAIAFTAVALGTAAASSLANVSLDVGDKISRELRSFGANLVVLPAGAQSRAVVGGEDVTRLRARSFLSSSDVLKVKENFWKNNILGFAPLLDVPARVGGRGVLLRGSWFQRRVLLADGRRITAGLRGLFPFWSVRGEWPLDLAPSVEPGPALLGRSLARATGVGPGGSVAVTVGGWRRTFPVAGILETGSEEDDAVLVPLETAQELAGLEGKMDGVLVSALTTPEDAVYERLGKSPRKLSPREFERWICTPFVSSIAHELAGAVPGSEAHPIRRVADTEGKILRKVGGLMALIAVMAAAGAALTVTSALTTGVLERRAEIGLLKALGASDAGVAALFLGEAALIGLAGGLAGGLLGLALSRAVSLSVFGTPGTVKALSLPIAAVAAIAITLAGCALPARRISGIRAAEALRG